MNKVENKFSDKDDREEYDYRGLPDTKMTEKEISQKGTKELKEQVDVLQRYITELHQEICDWRKEVKNRDNKIRISNISFLVILASIVFFRWFG